MLLLRNPRGTCACGQKNGWLCIRQHLVFWGRETAPHKTQKPFLLLLLLLISVCRKRRTSSPIDIRRQGGEEEEEEEEEEDQDQEEGKTLIHHLKQERG